MTNPGISRFRSYEQENNRTVFKKGSTLLFRSEANKRETTEVIDRDEQEDDAVVV